jgi:hypothetical protein
MTCDLSAPGWLAKHARVGLILVVAGVVVFATPALGLLACLLVPNMPSLFWRWVSACAAILAMLFIG